MASIIAAATALAAAAAGKQMTPTGYLTGLNYQINSSPSQGHIQNGQSSFNPDQMAAIAAAFKYNSAYSNSSMTQQNYLTKYMSLYYNKPMDFIQRMVSEQNDSVANMFNQGANLSNFQLNNIQKFANMRYHPYAKNNSGSDPHSLVFCPKIVHKNSRSPSPSESCASIGKERSSPIEPIESPHIDIDSSASTSSSISPENKN